MNSLYASDSVLYWLQLWRKEPDTVSVIVGGKIDHNHYTEPCVPYFRYTCKIQEIMPESISKTLCVPLPILCDLNWFYTWALMFSLNVRKYLCSFHYDWNDIYVLSRALQVELIRSLSFGEPDLFNSEYSQSLTYCGCAHKHIYMIKRTSAVLKFINLVWFDLYWICTGIAFLCCWGSIQKCKLCSNVFSLSIFSFYQS